MITVESPLETPIFRRFLAWRRSRDRDFSGLPRRATSLIAPARRRFGEAKVRDFLRFFWCYRMDASIWDQILTRIETKVNRHSFYTWFKPTSFVADGGGAITVRVPNPLFKDWLTKHYSVVLSEALAEVRRPDASLVFVAEGTAAAAAAAGGSPPAGDSSWSRRRPASPATAPGGLNPRYTFDTFIVGPSNQFAHAACRAVAEAPSRSYNPLFIYGGVGLGKTHLMHAVGQYVLQHDPSAEADLHLVRAVHERDDQRAALRPHPRFPRALPQRGRAARRRHPVRVGQGRHADRVLPHVQRALRRAEADRAQQRSSAARNPGARGTAAIALRVGADRRYSAAGSSRPRSRFSSEKPKPKRFRCRTTWRCTSPAASSRTSASSRDR